MQPLSQTARVLLRCSSLPFPLLTSVHLNLRALSYARGHASAIDDEHSHASLDHLTDMTAPASWYPLARLMKRHIVAHMGPTNSGKTHAALAALKAAPNGVYCGPLRLLASEVADRLNAQGLPCDLVTGQDVQRHPGARHTSCTVEMVDVDQRLEVAVIDEGQMLGDLQRGWSWTRALLGVAAAEVHVCGDPAVLPLLRVLAAQCGDDLEVRTYERLAPLHVEARPAYVPQDVKHGDCVVAFSRYNVHNLRRVIEGRGHHLCSVVYGALPPGARRTQAALFNNHPHHQPHQPPPNPPGHPHDSDHPHQHDTPQPQLHRQRMGAKAAAKRAGGRVLVATDAIGMGLNLAIRRVVFTTLQKYNGEDMQQLTASEVKQIAGRAGRYGAGQEAGWVTCADPDDLPYLIECLDTPSPPVQAACLFPRYDQLSAYADAATGGNLPAAIASLEAAAQLAPAYFFRGCEGMLALGALLQDVPLDRGDLFTFLISPADAADPPVARALLQLAQQYAKTGRLSASVVLEQPIQAAKTERDLVCLEATWRVLDLYMWLSRRLGAPRRRDVARASEAWQQCGLLIEQALLQGLKVSHNSSGRPTARRHCRQQGTALPKQV